MLIHSTQAVYRTVLQGEGAGGKFTEAIVLPRAPQKWRSQWWMEWLCYVWTLLFLQAADGIFRYSRWERGRTQDLSHTHSVASVCFPPFSHRSRISRRNLCRVSRDAALWKELKASGKGTNSSFSGTAVCSEQPCCVLLMLTTVRSHLFYLI